MAMIFSNVEPLLESSTQLFRGLIEQLSLPDFKQTIGQCFLQNMAELERYIFYCTRHSDATEMVEKFLKEEHFPIFCELAKSTKESKSLDILSYLIKPFQRICRYKLLLAEILKHTPKEWADYKSIELACAKLNRIVSKANEEQRVSDTIQKMIDIQNSFIWTDGEDQIKWSPNSTYVTEGGLKLLNSKGQTQKRYFFLFNDMLVISEQKGAKHIKKAVIPTNQVVIWDLPDTGCNVHRLLHHFMSHFLICLSFPILHFQPGQSSAFKSFVWILPRNIRSYFRNWKKKTGCSESSAIKSACDGLQIRNFP